MTSATIERTIDAPWLKAETLQTLLAVLSQNGEEARVVGGAVRNELMGRHVHEVDVATTTEPSETTRLAEGAGFRVVPTGFEHGTVTVVTPQGPYEVTTLREDVETNGRHAVVRFGKSWQADAERRDFTINALYTRADGSLVDLVGGLADMETRTLRFIGDASKRISEDYLRILRFFRFFAWYGSGRPDADGIRAVTRLKDGMEGLSAERVWSELKNLLGAPDPSRALLWMRQTGVLSRVLPESERWGIDSIHPLMEAEAAFGWRADALLRLEAIVPPDPQRLAEAATRLRMSNADRDRLLAFAAAEPVSAEESEGSLTKRLYYGNRTAVSDRLKLLLASTRAKTASTPEQLQAVAALSRQLSLAERFDPPVFPVSGQDLKEAGLAAGPELGRTLDSLKQSWVDSGFVLSKAALLKRI